MWAQVRDFLSTPKCSHVTVAALLRTAKIVRQPFGPHR